MRKLSYLLIIILLSSFLNLLPVRSQPVGCVNTNPMKTPEIDAQLSTWLNEPDGLNARFLASTESSFERGQRLFYDLVLNNNQICLSDLTQEMIDSITEVIRSYNEAPDHTYLVNGLTITRSQINLGFKDVSDPILLGKNSIFAEAIQTGLPIADIDSLINSGWLITDASEQCAIVAINCYTLIDEGSSHDPSDFIRNSCGNSFEVCIYTANLTSLIDPLTNDNFVYNYTHRKDTAGGRQKDTNISLLQDSTAIIQSQIIIDMDTSIFIQRNVTITSSNASLITDFTNLVLQITQRDVGGGATKSIFFSMFQLVIPDSVSNQPQIANATLWGLFNSSDTTYSILSLDGRDKVFQDQQIRLNLTVTDLDGRNNITEVHALFNATDTDQFLISFYNDSGTFIFNTTTPLIVENLEGLNTEITDGWNITFIFSLSDQLGPGYIWLSNANVTDNNSNSTLVRERWFSFIREPSAITPGGTGTSELFPLAPLMNLFFIIGGFLLVFNAKGRLEFQAAGMFFFLASLLFIISPIYAVLDSNNVLSYVVLNYPDNIRNNFVLINFVFIGLGLTSVIINNRSRIGF